MRSAAEGDASRNPDRNPMWIGWIEFAPLTDTATLKALPRVEQASRVALVYWAAGLERRDLQSALENANVLAGIRPAALHR